jgi:hypothetical protein
LDWSTITPVVVIALCSLITAGCSFFVALHNSRRSNLPIIRVVKSSHSYICSIDRGYYNEYRFVIQNLGIPMNNIGMSLVCIGEDGYGSGSFPLRTKDGNNIRTGQFAKGSITEFCFNTSMMKNGDDVFVKMLKDLKSQRACLVLHADQYEMWKYYLHDRFWSIKKRWNNIAHWLEWNTRKEEKTQRGTTGAKYRIHLKKFESAGQHLIEFIEYVRKSKYCDANNHAKSA